ncbi:WXG100 family type VII secretion target [uncultured Chloroflexus sp.]|uniref:WXG100 family type VII secretion target n=1 Tax=uncultured Chloroflexus sp. TaxID=214040 RepID=UPI00260DC6AF|nr:WXG100 family type VII secretion target [uncultured Chloroflexus sp.]
MAQIGADTEQLRAVVNAFRQGGNAITSELQRARQAMQSLQSSQWSGNHRQQAEAMWEQAQTRLNEIITALETLANRTEQFTNNLEEVGRSFLNEAAVSSVTAGILGNASADNGATSGTPFPGVLAFRPFAEGSTTVPGVLENTAGCTNYVLRRLNLDDMGWWPNAHLWNEAATRAGYVIDSHPVDKSVIVFEPGVLGAHSTYGHVAVVEQVERQADGKVMVRISEASLLYQEGSSVMGTHTTPTTRMIELREAPDGKVTFPDGTPIDGKISFILGRKE